MKIRNFTPHTINIFTEDGAEFSFPSEGMARVTASEEPFGEIKVTDGNINGIPVVRTTYGNIEGLPDPEPDTTYIVSYVVLNALAGSERTDCVAPNTSPQGAIRDADGKIMGVKGFQRL